MEIPCCVETYNGDWRARCRHMVEVYATDNSRDEAICVPR